MKNKSILLLVIFLGLAIISLAFLRVNNQEKVSTQPLQQSNKIVSYQSQTDEKGEVIVEVTPVNLSAKGNASFDIKFTTHSVDLDYDIKSIAVLTEDKGNELKAISWTGGKGGHHILGILTFPKLSEEATSVQLTIPKIDNKDRVFTWNLK